MGSKRKVVILDGGTGMSLYDRGIEEIETDPLWSALAVKEYPQALIDVHSAFYESGADIVVAATYQSSVEGFVKRFKVSEAEAEDLVTEGVRLAKKAKDLSEAKTGRKLFVAGSVGPYGATLNDRSEYHGKYVDTMSKQDLTTWHAKRIAAILKGKPDLLAVETIPAVKEAEAIIESLKNFSGVRAWISFQCKDGQHTAHGELFSDAVRTVMQSENVVAVGMNCSHPMDITPLLQSIADLDIPVPVLIKPNKGGAAEDRPEVDTKLTENMLEWVKLGATWIGGCCGYGPEDIAELHELLESCPDVELPGLEL